MSASNPTGTVLVEVSAEGPTGADAADLANAVAAGLAEEVSDIESSPDSTYTVDLALQIPAQPPASPSAPQRPVVLGLGLVAGLALGTVLALLLAHFDTRIRTTSDVRRVSGLPVLGQLRRRRASGRDGVALDPEAEGYVEAALNIRQANGGTVPSFILLAPTSSGAGPTQVRVGLARAYAATGRTALLIESIAEPLSPTSVVADLAERRGLCELLTSGSAEFTGSVRPIDVSSGSGEVWALPRGVEPASELVTERQFPWIVEAAEAYADLAIVQASTTTRPLDLRIVAPIADVVVVVARHGSTKEAELARVVTELRLEGVRPIGVVLVDVPRRHHTDLAAGWRVEDFAHGSHRAPQDASQHRPPIVPIQSRVTRPGPDQPDDADAGRAAEARGKAEV
ncbi:hypothetical protein ACGGZK_07575 [Agromyces sp. MMS24-K17]|uniref:hypothetical protein n=1 Tax=Agromyces sp. MMS24-K17 TaxID=3372850 RepID=UPI003754641F